MIEQSHVGVFYKDESQTIEAGIAFPKHIICLFKVVVERVDEFEGDGVVLDDEDFI